MTDKQIEALKLALEALKQIDEAMPFPVAKFAQAAIRSVLNEHGEALAAVPEGHKQPAQQQEPVAYASDVEFDDETEIIPAEQKGKLGTAGLRIPLYIKPPASKPWVGLDETDLAVCDTDGVRLARYWERVLREKNNGTR